MSTKKPSFSVLVVAAVLAASFLFLRFYNLSSSLLYFNDMGRDSLVLLDWKQTGKPPLLGPQTSALPFNQSALYFYTLYPMFLLTNMSPFSAIYTVVMFHLVFLLAGVYVLRNKPLYLRSFLITFGLVTLHPQSILQNRFVWNPSFVSVFLTVAVLSFLWLKEKWSWKTLTALVLALAIANAFSYSMVPIILALFVLSPFLFRWRSLWIYGGFAVASFFANAPTLAFEVRHRFVLLKMLVGREKIPQQGAGFVHQAYDLVLHTFSHQQFEVSVVIAALLTMSLLFGYFWYRQHSRSAKLEAGTQQSFHLTLLLLLLSIGFTLVIPMSIHSHYIFGISTLLFLTIGFLPWRQAVVTTAVLACFWSVPIIQGQYFTPARRTVAELESCFAEVCRHEADPLYVSEQAGFHPFHNAPEHRFLMRKAGCKVQDIEKNPGAANKMAVILDDGTYEHGKTAYNELTLFGPSKQTRNYICKENFQVRILEK